MTIRARYPELLQLSDPPVITGHRCTRCERVAFPPDPYGCEACGAPKTELSTAPLAAVGTIRAMATVHRHHHPRPETPFIVATIELEDGPVLKAVLDGDTSDATVGAVVRGKTVPWETDDDGTSVVDLRFEVVS